MTTFLFRAPLPASGIQNPIVTKCVYRVHEHPWCEVCAVAGILSNTCLQPRLPYQRALKPVQADAPTMNTSDRSTR
jgi:hypothetical protein